MDMELVKERIQADFNPSQLLLDIDQLKDERYRSQLLEGYAELRSRLGGSGASMRAANAIVLGSRKTS